MRPRGASRDATRQRLVKAATELFARQGFAATGIRDIANAAGMTSSSLYEYMTTKDDLLVDIMRNSIEPLIQQGRAVRRSRREPELQLAALTECHVRFHASHPGETAVTDTELRALHGARRAQVVALRDRYEAVWREVVADGVKQGVFDVVDQRVAVRSLLSLCTGISAWYRPGGRLTIERLCATHADLALATVRATRDGRPVRRDGLTDAGGELAIVQPR
jgi:AcrR family transcriptional regulator